MTVRMAKVCCNQLRIRAHNFYEKQGMSKFHYKFTMNLHNEEIKENRLGICVYANLKLGQLAHRKLGQYQYN
jgi:hypothetical protein